MAQDYLGHFTLVGGTALALQLGHRKSIDLDLFSVSELDTDVLLESLSKDCPIVARVKTAGSLITEIEGIKVDFIRFKYRWSFPAKLEQGIRILAVEDIAPMKLDAIAGRGNKKDFYDLYFLLDLMSLPQMLKLYSGKYQHSTLFHAIKSLTWFEDAEPRALPDVLLKEVELEPSEEAHCGSCGSIVGPILNTPVTSSCSQGCIFLPK